MGRYNIFFRVESVYEDEITRPPINLTDIDLGVLFSNLTRKQHLEDVRKIKTYNLTDFTLT